MLEKDQLVSNASQGWADQYWEREYESIVYDMEEEEDAVPTSHDEQEQKDSQESDGQSNEHRYQPGWVSVGDKEICVSVPI